MISDLVIGIVHLIYDGIVGLLPDMPARPEAFDQLWRLFEISWYLLPVEQLLGFIPVMLLTFGGLALWRGIRLLLPGG